MEPEIQPPLPQAPPAESSLEPSLPPDPDSISPDPWETRVLRQTFLGSHGLRAGWSLLIFYSLYRLFSLILGTLAVDVDPALAKFSFSPTMAFWGEFIPFLAILGAVAIVARIERRNLLDYNLAGPRPAFHFASGLAAGFLALSVLISGLFWGGWLNFGPIALSGIVILKFAALWALVFLLVGLVEEGSFRCYLQFTFARGLNFWWALAVVGAACLDLVLRTKGNGAWGVYLVALLGLAPCLFLHLKKIHSSGFWQAAWVTSTLFGFIHTGNNGENWIGIFAAAAIGFVFCVSVRVTGSAWWAIGCHSAWDWAETYFYGTADSGLTAQGHYLTTNPSGAVLWSGGTDGPEGSLLVIPVVLLLLVVILLLHGRRKPALPGLHASSPVSEPAAG